MLRSNQKAICFFSKGTLTTLKVVNSSIYYDLSHPVLYFSGSSLHFCFYLECIGFLHFIERIPEECHQMNVL